MRIEDVPVPRRYFGPVTGAPLYDATCNSQGIDPLLATDVSALTQHRVWISQLGDWGRTEQQAVIDLLDSMEDWWDEP